MSIRLITSEIISGNFTNDELSSIIDAVKYARAQLAKQNKRSVTIGSTVSFVNSRTGRKEVGNVTGIKVKNLIIRVGTMSWRVPASMVSVEEA